MPIWRPAFIPPGTDTVASKTETTRTMDSSYNNDKRTTSTAEEAHHCHEREETRKRRSMKRNQKRRYSIEKMIEESMVKATDDCATLSPFVEETNEMVDALRLVKRALLDEEKRLKALRRTGTSQEEKTSTSHGGAKKMPPKPVPPGRGGGDSHYHQHHYNNSSPRHQSLKYIRRHKKAFTGGSSATGKNALSPPPPPSSPPPSQPQPQQQQQRQPLRQRALVFGEAPPSSSDETENDDTGRTGLLYDTKKKEKMPVVTAKEHRDLSESLVHKLTFLFQRKLRQQVVALSLIPRQSKRAHLRAVTTLLKDYSMKIDRIIDKWAYFRNQARNAKVHTERFEKECSLLRKRNKKEETDLRHDEEELLALQQSLATSQIAAEEASVSLRKEVETLRAKEATMRDQIAISQSNLTDISEKYTQKKTRLHYIRPLAREAKAQKQTQRRHLNRLEAHAQKAANIPALVKHVEALKALLTRELITQNEFQVESTCLSCLKSLDDPVTLWPCGHIFCRRCAEQATTAEMQSRTPKDTDDYAGLLDHVSEEGQ